MAAKKNMYYAQNGAAAYDIYSTRFDNNAARTLPEERRAPVVTKKVKAKLAIKPFVVVGILAVACLLMMVVYGYVQLYETTSEVGTLNSQLTQLQSDNARLQSEYESSIKLTEIEQRARELGMMQPTGNQVVYLNISGTDRAEVLHTETENIFVRTWSAIRDSFMGILEYFF